jgi:hypothetical protein
MPRCRPDGRTSDMVCFTVENDVARLKNIPDTRYRGYAGSATVPASEATSPSRRSRESCMSPVFPPYPLSPQAWASRLRVRRLRPDRRWRASSGPRIP